MLKEWSEFRVEITKRRLEHEKMVAEKRLHIVQGRIKVIDAIREAIDLIQSADDPKKALMERFELSEVQATDVLDMRLRQLAKLEGQALEKERNELEKTIARLSRLLAKTKELVQLVIQEIEDDIKLLGDDPRRTVVEEIAEVDEGVSKGKVTSKLPEDPITVALSEKFWVRAKTGHDQPAEGFVFKTGDTVASLLNSTTHETLVIMDHTGRIYNLDASEIPNARGGEGLPLSASFEAQGKFVNAWMTKEGRKYLIASDAGHGFVAPSADMLTRMKAGKVMLTPVANSLPMTPIEVTGLAEDTRVYCLSTDGSLVGFALSELPEMGKGKGVALMGLREGCKVASIVLASPQEKVGIKEGEKVKWLKFEELELAFGPRSSGKKGKVVTKLKDVKLVKE
jgi:topoisomerase-4 subunit A